MPNELIQTKIENLECRINITITNEDNDSIINDVVVDTGTSEDLTLPFGYRDILEELGLILYDLGPEPIGFGPFGEEIVLKDAKMTLAKITKVGETKLMNEGFEITIIIFGEGDPLIGMNTLRKWVSTLNGPDELLIITEP